MALLLHEAAYTELVASLVKLGIVLFKRGRVCKDGAVDQPRWCGGEDVISAQG